MIKILDVKHTIILVAGLLFLHTGLGKTSYAQEQEPETVEKIVEEINDVLALDGDDEESEKVENDETSTKEDSAFTGKNFDKLSWKGSIMFSSDEIDEIYTALAKYDPEKASKSSVTTDFVSTDIDPAFIDVERKKFSTVSLNSIMYFSPEDWSVWVNNKKIRSGDMASSGIEVIKVTKSYAVIIMKSDSLDEILAPDWKNRMIETDGSDSDNTPYRWQYTSRDKTISVDENSGAIKFALKPNQTALLATMEISEGTTESISPYGTNTLNGFESPFSTDGSDNVESGVEFESLVDEIFQSVSP